MLEGTNEVRRGTISDALRAARAEIVTWNAADAGITDLLKCGLRGSPTVVKRVFAPTPRAEKAMFVDIEGKAPGQSADALIDLILAHKPTLENDLVKFARGY
jgi:electron transfer flavoprotein beta subunit